MVEAVGIAASAGPDSVAAMQDEVERIAGGARPPALADAPLWPRKMPDDKQHLWHALRSRLLPLGWDGRVNWYELRLEGERRRDA